MLQINISTQPARLSYNIQNARLNLQTTKPMVQMETIPAIVEIHQPHGELTMDMTPCRYSIGLKNNADFARDNSALGRQAAMQAIARIAEEGDRMAQINIKSNAVAEIAAQSMKKEIPEITYAHIDSPEIHYQAKPVQYNPIGGKINFTFLPGTVQGDYQPGSLDIQVAQYPSIEMSVVDVKV